jgi:hypothetical protein
MSGDQAVQEIPEQNFEEKNKAASWIETENTSSSCRQFDSVALDRFLVGKLRLRGHLYIPFFVCGDLLTLAVNIKHIAQTRRDPDAGKAFQPRTFAIGIFANASLSADYSWSAVECDSH